MVEMAEVEKVLRTCYDPEIPMNIVDLGLVYDVSISGEHVDIKMTLTAIGCPLSHYITEDVRRKLEAIDGVHKANVEIVWEPRWTPAKMEDAKNRSFPWMAAASS
jgi:metal-sulfur cluster biosynthetic enzyme